MLGSGVCELTNQRRLGICDGRVLKRQELKHSVSDRGAIRRCSTGQYETTDVFFTILIVTQNIMMNIMIMMTLKMNITSLLKHLKRK